MARFRLRDAALGAVSETDDLFAFMNLLRGRGEHLPKRLTRCPVCAGPCVHQDHDPALPLVCHNDLCEKYDVPLT